MKALILIDLHMEMQHRIDAGRDCVHPDAPVRIAALARAFRARGLPVLHVRHRDGDPASPLHPGAAGHAPMPCAEARPAEPVFEKTTSSAFASTGLEAHLRAEGVTELVAAGAVAGFCVSSLVRAGADLGFGMTVARDAVIGFDLPEAGIGAQAAFDVVMAHLGADFAQVMDAAQAIETLG